MLRKKVWIVEKQTPKGRRLAWEGVCEAEAKRWAEAWADLALAETGGVLKVRVIDLRRRYWAIVLKTALITMATLSGFAALVGLLAIALLGGK